MMKRASLLLFVLAACSNDLGSSTFDASLPPPPLVTPPVVACTMPDAGCDAAWCDAGYMPASTCALPPSVCADGHWAAYFDDGVCVSGTCQLVTKYHYCDQGCMYGACISNRPTAPSRGF